MKKLYTGYFCGLRGYSISMTLEQASSASHQGQCDEDVEWLARDPAIAKQLDGYSPEQLVAALKEYGAWDAEELADHEQNKLRALWSAACDIREEYRTELNAIA